MSAPEQHPAVPYDPLLDQPSSPRLSGTFQRQVPGYSDATPNDSPHLHPNQLPPGAATPQPSASGKATPLPAIPGEFGTPRPGYFDSSYRAESMASSTNVRASNYGSIAPLQRDSTYGGYPPKEGEMGMSGSGRGSDEIREKQELYAAPRQKTKRKAWIIGGIIIGLIILIVAVVVPVYVLVIKPKGGVGELFNGGSGNTNSGSHNNNTSSGNNHHNNFATWGGDGSVVTKDDGTTFTYNNSFGGYWTFDPQNPLNNSARAQSYTPPLSEDWPWGSQNIYGVNLGGWLVLEPFIAPSLYEPFFPNAVDEWTLSQLIMARDGNLNAIEEHYKTFITEEDFAQIAAAGLNWVRIPLPFWAIEVYPGEPFLAKTCWTYFLKAIEWARKYGLRINVDLHAVPGSQNGWNHSGKTGEVDFLAGVMGIANAQRTMDYIRIIAEFISQPEIQPVVPYFGILNEPVSGNGGFPKAAIREFYAQAYRVLREAGNGYGAGKGPYMSIHEAFWGLADWTDFLPGADRIALDHHPYLIFTTLDNTPASAFPAEACNNWSGMVQDSLTGFGLTAAGEWSNAINDCGLYVNAVGAGSRYEGTFDGNPVIGSCDPWNDYSTWDDTTKATLKQLGAATMDALGNWFFWTWKIGPSSATGKIMSPFWSYQLAVQEGWAVTDPRTSVGTCTQLGSTGVTQVTLKANQVGTDTNPTVPDLTTYNWPPDTIGGFEGAAQAATLPTYTATGPIPTLPTATFASATPTLTNDGWNNPADQTLMAVPIPGCAYPDAWAAVAAAVPNCAA